jgi:hypothetical protein
MALKKPKEDAMDLTEDTQWAEDVVKEFGRFIPEITGIPKSAATTNLHFRIGGDIADLCTSLAYKHSTIFKTPSEAFRAAFYIGTMFLYTKHKGKKGDDSRGDITYNILVETEVLRISDDQLDRVTVFASELKRAVNNNLISWDEFYSKVNNQINLLPPNLRQAADKNINKIIAGSNVSDLISHKATGRPRKENVDY